MATAAPNPLASGDTAYLYRAAIGERSQDYYLRHFARFDGEGRTGTSWNWAAYWTTLNWLIYRKMWGWALAYLAALIGLALLIFGVGKLVFNYSDTSAILLSLALLTAAFVLPGLYANAWFYTHCNEKITAVLQQTPEIKQAATVLAADAPAPRRLWLLALANTVLLALVLLAMNRFQQADSTLPQLATHEERVPVGEERLTTREQAGRVAAAPTATPAASALAASSVAEPAASAPATGSAPASAAAAEPATVARAPEVAAAQVPEPAPMIKAVDRTTTPARAEAAAAPRKQRPAPPAPAAEAPPAAPARPVAATKAAIPLRYVWVLQVGAYAQEENARKALAQVQSLGLEAGAESFGSQPLTRVRVGPFTRQVEAEQAALRIKSLDLPVLMIRQRP